MSADDETGTGHEPDSEPTVSSRRRWVAVAGLVTADLLAVSLVPPALVFGPSPDGGTITTGLGPLGLVGRDKWLHAVGYAVLAGTLVPALDADLPSRHAVARTALLAVVVATAVGLGIELLQWPHPARTASLADATANLFGACVGAGVSAAIRRRVTA